jgi:hypothetical protein
MRRRASIAMHLVYFAPAVVFGLYYFYARRYERGAFKSLLDSEHAVEEIEKGNKCERKNALAWKKRSSAQESRTQIAIANPKNL